MECRETVSQRANPQPTDEWSTLMESQDIEMTDEDDDDNGVSVGFRTRDLRIHNPAL